MMIFIDFVEIKEIIVKSREIFKINWRKVESFNLRIN